MRSKHVDQTTRCKRPSEDENKQIQKKIALEPSGQVPSLVIENPSSEQEHKVIPNLISHNFDT